MPIQTKPAPRIMIVDDDADITLMLSQMLNEEFDCECASSAEEAIKRLAESHFQVVLSDISMPGMSGLEMLPLVKSVSPHTVVVMISGLQALESAISALRLGAFDYLTKPFDLRQVEAVVQRAFEHYELVVAKEQYDETLEQLVEQRTQQLDSALLSLESAYRSTLRALTAALETRDAETHGHSERVVSYSLRLGREFNLDERQMKALEFGALLHDVGKIGVPDSILRKPTKLSEEEWARMRQHPFHGQQILRGIDFLEGAAIVVAQHHEKWDGSGYPRGLKGEEIDLCARIFAVADCFDAVTSDRVYRRATCYEVAVQELVRSSGKQFDPKVVDMFQRVPKADWEDLSAGAIGRNAPRGHSRSVALATPLLQTQFAAAY